MRLRMLAVGLASLAGFVDAIAYLQLGGFFVSFMSGNSTRLAVRLVMAPRLALVALGLIAMFVTGVFLGSLAGRAAGRWRRPAVLALVTLTLAVCGGLVILGLPGAAAVLLAAAMGMENAAFERDGEARIAVTYMTRALVRLGQGVATAVTGGDRRGWLAYLALWSYRSGSYATLPEAEADMHAVLPNPNVMIELGYAMSVLDHERIVLVMNRAEKADLAKLPFDLRHWRAPASYTLRKDATPEQRFVQAAALKADLRMRIEPGLRKAARLRQEEAHLALREPRFEVRAVEGEDQALTIRRTPDAPQAPTLDEIKARTPLLAKPARDPILPRYSARSVTSLAGFSRPRPVSEWTAVEVDTYNRSVESYYSAYAAYLLQHEAWRRLLLRTFRIEFVLDNTGGAPGTGIDLILDFPDRITLHENDDALAPPEPPKPPEKVPMSPGIAIARHVTPDFDFPLLTARRTTHVFAAERRVAFEAVELKHHHSARVDPVTVSFADDEAVGPFEVDYMVTAREPRDPTYGQVRFEVQIVD